MRAETLREVVTFYQQNREQQNIAAFTQDELYKLEQNGLDRAKADNVKNLIAFLSKQAHIIPVALFEYLNKEKPKYKIDLRGINIGRTSGVAAVFAAALNMQHPICRVDLTGFECDEDVGNVVSLFLKNKKITLRELHCSGNLVDYKGFNQLYKNATKYGVQYFAANAVKLPQESALLIPTFIESSERLRVLSLEGNNIPDNIGNIIL